jgi:hypothetical protein
MRVFSRRNFMKPLPSDDQSYQQKTNNKWFVLTIFGLVVILVICLIN